MTETHAFITSVTLMIYSPDSQVIEFHLWKSYGIEIYGQSIAAFHIQTSSDAFDNLRNTMHIRVWNEKKVTGTRRCRDWLGGGRRPCCRESLFSLVLQDFKRNVYLFANHLWLEAILNQLWCVWKSIHLVYWMPSFYGIYRLLVITNSLDVCLSSIRIYSIYRGEWK